MKKYTTRLIILLVSSQFVHVHGQVDRKYALPLSKGTIQQSAVFDGNRIRVDFENNGMLTSHRVTGHSGLEWPRGSGKYAEFAAGIWVGGKVDGEIRVTAADYAGEWSPGPWGADPLDPRHRVYKVNRSDLEQPELYPDVVEWPADLGAPWIDANDDGQYNVADGDLPDMQGDQMLWSVLNDGVASAHTIFGSPPLGLELQVTMWGRDEVGSLGDTRFIKIVIYNRGGSSIDEAFVGIWSDPDLGNAGDDFAATDTSLDMFYVYNDGPDAQYGPGGGALGWALLQGTIVPAPGEIAQAFGEALPDYMNQRAYTLRVHLKSHPTRGASSSAIQAYYMLSGLGRDGQPLTNSATGEITRYDYYDHPALDRSREDSIWVYRDDRPSGDVRMSGSVGPFNLAPGDSQEVVWMQAIGLGSDPFNSIDVLKDIIARAYINETMVEEMRDLGGIPISTTTLNEQIVLTWENLAQAAESFAIDTRMRVGIIAATNNVHFEGYNVYQFSDEAGHDPQLIATFDLANGITSIKDWISHPVTGEIVYATVHVGADGGLQRYVIIDNDAHNQGKPLINSREYFFGVRALFASTLDELKFFESAVNIISIRPSIPYNAVELLNPGTTIPAIQTGPTTGGDLEVMVIRPDLITDANYTITFDVDGLWYLYKGDQLVITANEDLDGGNDSPIVDGLLIMVTAPDSGKFSANDQFTFSTSLPKSTDPDVQDVTIWPNPYFAFNPEETTPSDHRVTIDHLPPTATIRIFNIGGDLVRKIAHNNGTQQEIWDLRNHSNRDVASGMYIVLVESDYGKKVLKLGVVMAERSGWIN